MEWRLDQVTPAESAKSSVQSAPAVAQGPVLVRDEPKKLASLIPIQDHFPAGTGPALVRDEVRAEYAPYVPQPSQQPAVQVPVQPDPPQTAATPAPAAPMQQRAVKPEAPKRGWLSRLLSPEPSDARKAARQPVAGLVAHFFTGGAPVAHEIRDVSATGLYVVTTERWYPGTIIRMTLSKPDVGQSPTDRSITIQAESMRWGNDGVGLRFILAAPGKAGQSTVAGVGAVDVRQLANFLKGAVTD